MKRFHVRILYRWKNTASTFISFFFITLTKQTHTIQKSVAYPKFRSFIGQQSSNNLKYMLVFIKYSAINNKLKLF